MNDDATCGTRKKFICAFPEKGKSELTTPEKCRSCNVDQMDYCIEKSWLDQGKNPKLFKLNNVMLNQHPNADKAAEKVIEKTEETKELAAEISKDADEIAKEEEEVEAEE